MLIWENNLPQINFQKPPQNVMQILEEISINQRRAFQFFFAIKQETKNKHPTARAAVSQYTAVAEHSLIRGWENLEQNRQLKTENQIVTYQDNLGRETD